MSEEPLPDGLLLRRYCEDGDEAAFAELRRRHGRLVLAVCRRETGDPALAEDAAQGTFLLLIRKSFDERASLAGWLHSAARLVSKNLVREETRRRRRERRAFEEFQEPTPGWNAAAPHIDAALAALQSGDREAVLLRFAGDQSLAEVGRTLGIGENAARMRVSRALERMRLHLRREGVGLSVLLLATLLSTRLAEAEPLPAAPPSPRALRLAQVGLPKALGLQAALIGIAAVGLGLFGAKALLTPSELGSLETKILFSRTVGEWRGTLEFADDRTGAHTKSPTTVSVDRPNGGLRLTAHYARFRNVDTTTIVPRGDGRFEIENGGAGNSHRLDGLYRLQRGRGGTPEFVGFSLAVRGEVRLKVEASANSLRLLEEYRRDGGEYRFRNLFDLRR